MDPDLVMTFGIGLAIFSFLPLIGAILHDGQASKIVVFFVLVSVSVMLIANFQKPGGYDFLELPDIFISVIMRYV